MFLECWQVPTQCIALQTYQEVHAWIQRLIRSYSFCPSESGRSLDLSSNVCAYISDPATIEGYPLSERQVFRFVPDKTSTKSIHQRAAERIAEKYGKDLYRYCNMGKEANIYANALHCCMTQFSPDFRALLYNAPIFDTSKHIRKLKLQGEAPGLAVGGQSTSPDQFVVVRRSSQSIQPIAQTSSSDPWWTMASCRTDSSPTADVTRHPGCSPKT